MLWDHREILLTPSKYMSICSFGIRGSDVTWDVSSHVLEITFAPAKMVPFLKWGTCRRTFGQAATLVYVKILSTTDKVRRSAANAQADPWRRPARLARY